MTLSAQSQSETPDERFSHLRTATTSYRLNQIERIRANGVGDLVALPQLVVCGDQSAGKSSVLEGITGIPFPRQEGLCTRFPTEIILRHTESNPTTIVASIRPHVSRTSDVRNTLVAYQKDIRDMSELPSIIQDASRLMNIRGYSDTKDGYAFAPDALRIEISGSIGLHLTVVDLPGLISVANDEQTEEDVDAVHDMVTAYLQSSRTIILAVLQASNDMANQPIIKLARKHDPQGQRTVGIITKPDLINQGAESKIALVAKNQDTIRLKLGFFLVKNPSPSELDEGLTMDTRSNRELRFFSTSSWASQNLDMDRVGAEKLRTFLQQLLDTHIERELPKVRDEIRKCLTTTEAELRSLGDARPTVGHIRSFLTSLSMRFYELLQAALDGNYHSIDSKFFSENDDSRLRARIQETNTNFAAHMRDHGQRRRLRRNSESGGSVPESNSSDGSESTDETAQLIISKAEMTQWVKQAYSRTRGRELPGNYNSALLAELFQEQSRPWTHIAEAHIYDVLGIASQWIRLANERLVHEESLRREIDAMLREWLENTEKLALDELNKLIDDERRSPLTYNHYYTDNIQKARLDTQKTAVKNAVNLVAAQDWHGKLHISNVQNDIDRFVSSIGSRITVDMDEQACHEAKTELDSYYKPEVAMKTFVDNVARQVIERHIVSPLPKAFCPNSVAQLSDEMLLRIGSEPEKQTLRRDKLTALAQGLRRSLKDLQVSL
ncbi:Interferon-induced GTP-binding protein Mx-like protein [Hapsidospora chrysogenum ATCC 11550]|uniref:Interferon-induced GTP-binding protein Mx-like protein n=1 Tax=Hapsidospora chrysogenum (strain ATCC 11550 / CBS 779.69 / DSM 880 / IAM 14645 / JCM 23072 / IMI 49137) TaxID=857340 RepID=A0A086SZH5_HAPC1|nr:Interferon-induced GTP-binding protein Mx-like protein [Hapsidospora chrysogenum ATCC 11550]